MDWATSARFAVLLLFAFEAEFDAVLLHVQRADPKLPAAAIGELDIAWLLMMADESQRQISRLQYRGLLLDEDDATLRRVEVPQHLAASCVAREDLQLFLDLGTLVLVIDALRHHIEVACSQMRTVIRFRNIRS